ncbi:MAG: glucose 1-dehydrogenase [Candidatus Hydrogenedentes bacterium]|nr:glucose 1-dehydrogenase [Candidatus Hydrogenedentota bacterium]
MSCEARLAGRKALVTGSGTGIGREIALECARQGADVVLHYAHSDAGALSAAEAIHALGRKTAVLQANFDDVDEVLTMGEEALDFLGGVNCLINNAGITFNKPFLKVTREQFDRMYHVNIRAQFFLTQLIVAEMEKRGGGAICNITSIHGVQGAPEHSVYAGTKGAIIAYTRALAVELAHKGIRVNAIAPGWVTVENYFNVLPGFNEQDARRDAAEKVPLGTSGVPLDIAKLAVFLCSDDARYIVGQTIVADGGTTSLMSLISDFRSESTARFGKGYLPDV